MLIYGPSGPQSRAWLKTIRYCRFSQTSAISVARPSQFNLSGLLHDVRKFRAPKRSLKVGLKRGLQSALQELDKAPLAEEASYYSQKCSGDQFPSQNIKYAGFWRFTISRRGVSPDDGLSKPP